MCHDGEGHKQKDNKDLHSDVWGAGWAYSFSGIAS